MNESDDTNMTTMRRLSAVLSADVEGYSRLMGDDEEATVRTLTAYRAVFAESIARHHGRVVDSPGDNLLAEFASALDAVRCAVAVQSAIEEKNEALAHSRRMQFRIGINVGDVLVEDERIYGDGVNIAARVESAAVAGGVCISSTVHDQVVGKLDWDCVDIGEHQFKNITRPVRVFRISTGLIVSAPDPATARVRPAPSGKPSIAVLPFENRSGDPDQSYFSDGMTEDLITDLSKISGLFVISRSSVFTYKGTSPRPETVAADLGVRYIVEGSVRKRGKGVRITAQLIDAQTDFQLWAERYDRELDDIFAVQDDVIQRIATSLAVTLTAGEQARVGVAPTTNLDAYDAFVRGREEYTRRERAANTEARRLFETAVGLDPGYAEACAYLGRTYLAEMVNQWTDDPDILETIFRYGKQAVELDPAQSAAHETLAYGYLALREHDKAIAAAREAVRFDPNAADAYITLAEILSFSGRPAEAAPLIEQAMRLNPRYTPNYLWAGGQAQRLLGNNAAAITLFKRVVARNPDNLVAHLMIAACHADAGQLEAAHAAVAEVRRISPAFSLETSLNRSPYRDQAEIARQHESLRAAGLD